jgi:hypothetical protein
MREELARLGEGDVKSRSAPEKRFTNARLASQIGRALVGLPKFDRVAFRIVDPQQPIYQRAPHFRARHCSETPGLGILGTQSGSDSSRMPHFLRGHSPRSSWWAVGSLFRISTASSATDGGAAESTCIPGRCARTLMAQRPRAVLPGAVGAKGQCRPAGS